MPSQLTMFPFDPWGAQQMFTVVDRPHLEIARAMIGPFILGHAVNRGSDRLQCLAVSEDGAFASSMRIPVEMLSAPNLLWNRVVFNLNSARQRPISLAKHNAPVTPRDCLKVWSTSAFWISKVPRGASVHLSVRALSRLMAIREFGGEAGLTDQDRLRLHRQAQAVVADQIASGVLHVVKALRSELFEIINDRPRLSVSMAYQLLIMAQRHSDTATRHALQILRTESSGILNLITSGLPEIESFQIRDAIFNGQCLPTAGLSGYQLPLR